MKEKFLANSLYVHFPFCRHLCNYCDFFKRIPQSSGEVETFQNLLKGQFHSLQNLLKENSFEIAPLETLYFGGGTPSLWGADGALFWSDFVKKSHLSFAVDYEFTMELNPGSWSEKDLEAWRLQGLNRISMGMQSLDPRFIKILDRVHDRDEVLKTLKMLNKSELNFSVDFILGLPFSEEYKRDVISELEEVLSFQPKHLSLYILTVKSNYVHSKNLPSEEYIENEYLKVSEHLRKNNFIHYEVSNFALEGYKSRHNQKYWELDSTLALGPSSTGFLNSARLRFKWKEDFEPLLEPLEEAEINLEKCFLKLRTSEGIGTSFFSEQGEEKAIQLFQEWSKRGFGQVENKHFRPSAKGFLIMDSLINDLMSHKLL
ncbi:MAG: radical SAM family heme chaperone HemW [Bdellovibrio sp.]